MKIQAVIKTSLDPTDRFNVCCAYGQVSFASLQTVDEYADFVQYVESNLALHDALTAQNNAYSGVFNAVTTGFNLYSFDYYAGSIEPKVIALVPTCTLNQENEFICHQCYDQAIQTD